MGFASWQRYCTASSSGRQPKFAALNRGRHLCSTGQPSRWALAHILVLIFVSFVRAKRLAGKSISDVEWDIKPYSIQFNSWHLVHRVAPKGMQETWIWPNSEFSGTLVSTPSLIGTIFGMQESMCGVLSHARFQLWSVHTVATEGRRTDEKCNSDQISNFGSSYIHPFS